MPGLILEGFQREQGGFGKNGRDGESDFQAWGGHANAGVGMWESRSMGHTQCKTHAQEQRSVMGFSVKLLIYFLHYQKCTGALGWLSR